MAAARWFWANSNVTPTYYQIRTANLATIRPLYTADSVGGNPATSNVRSGTVYGPAGELTGTCAVPGAGSVALGVPVDNTTGTAAITAANIRDAVGLAIANLDTQLSGLSSGQSTINTNVLSRLAAADYTAPPSASTIAAAVWAATSRTLTTTIASATDIATAVWAAAVRTITGGTVDTLTNAPNVPTAAQIAGQVRTELSTELARIDVATSTRLAPAGTLARVTLVDATTTLTNAPDVPSAEEIAAEVRTELATELARLSNASTTQEVADIVEGAMQP